MLHVDMYKILLDIWCNIDGFQCISILLDIVHSIDHNIGCIIVHNICKYCLLLYIILLVMLLEIFQYYSILYIILYIILLVEFPDIVQIFTNNYSILFIVFYLILRVILSNIRSKIVYKIDDKTANNFSILHTILFKCPP